MKKIIIFFAALAAVLSCTKENPSNYNPVDGTYSVTLSASAPGADTKTTLVDGGVDVNGKPIKFVHWFKGDAIKVLFFPNRNNGNEITGPSGVFTSDFQDESSANANFITTTWSWAGISHDIYNDQRKNRLAKTGVAVYPNIATAVSNKPTSSTGAELESEISFVLPEAQNAVEGNIESGLNFSYADVDRDSFIRTVDNGSRTELTFKNACALIQLTMPDEMQKKVTSISITSNDKVALTGKGSLNLNYYMDVVEGGVTVTEGKGVVLNSSTGFEAGKTYYAVVWPGTHSGLTVEFAAEDGSIATKTTGKVTLAASKVKPYAFNKGLDFESAQIEEGDFIYADGTTGDESAGAVAVVFYKGKPQDIDPTVPVEFSRGLAISLKAYDVKWNAVMPSYDSSLKCSNSTDVPGLSIGAWEARNKWLLSNSTMTLYMSNYGSVPNKASSWYHGTHKEWSLIFASLGEINEKLSVVSGAQLIDNTSEAKGYWTPLINGSKPYIVYWNGKAAVYVTEQWYSYTGQCGGARPIFAF